MRKGYLVLETGDIFEGQLIGHQQQVMGEVVFNTGMTGYQEMMTDPSYAGQILVFCYPLIGNYGINQLDNESNRPHLAGVVVGEACTQPNHYLRAQSFSEHLAQQQVPGLSGIDTRALVQLIRSYGTLKGYITPELPAAEVQQALWSSEESIDLLHTCWVKQVSTQEIKSYPNSGPHVVLMDYGYKKSILKVLIKLNCRVTVVPYDTSFEQIQRLQPDGVLYSNGPGDPMTLEAYFEDIKKITEAYPSMGICLGHQLIALAHGAKTDKLKYGHRGGNHPVKHLPTGKVAITAQNHGYVVVKESIPDTFDVTYVNVNDQSIEGLAHRHLPIQTVQFHPEAHPGPSDTAYQFKTFIQQMSKVGDVNYAIT
jgi:carbamoyl-phosphate synthase small subunit